MLRWLVEQAGAARRGVVAAVRAQTKVFVLVTVAAFALHIALPPLLLSVARKPADFSMVNPLARTLPAYVQSGPGQFLERLEKAWNLALFWFSSSSPYGGTEWGFAVSAADLARFLLMSLLIGAYFAIWAQRRTQFPAHRWQGAGGGQGGALGGLWSVFGVATGGCTVMGCGAPVIPVAGLAFTGLSSTTLQLMSDVSALATAATLAAFAASILYLGAKLGSGR